jgi:predicted MFS family arabinose efflux permease
MRPKITTKILFAGLALFMILSVFLVFNRGAISLKPWEKTGMIEWIVYASGNDERIAVTGNSTESVAVLDSKKELIYQVDAKADSQRSFNKTVFIAMDEDNNLYVLDWQFGGAREESVERILKYSGKGEFLAEIYEYRYINDDFIISKGKICGLAYFNGAVYAARMGDEGFWIDRVQTSNGGKPEEAAFIKYPQAFRDLMYFHINAETKHAAVVTKSGRIKQYAFSGELVSEWEALEGSLPYMVITDNDNNIAYTDILTGEIGFIDTKSGERSLLFTPPEGSIYEGLDYVDGKLFAVTYEQVLVRDEQGTVETIDSYSYTQEDRIFRMVLFGALILDGLLLLLLVTALIVLIKRRGISGALKRILLIGICITAGAGIASVVIIKNMSDQYIQNTFTTLENVSRLMASTIDLNVLVKSPSQYDNEAYLRQKDALKELFERTDFTGKHIYQGIWAEQDGMVYSMYDLEHALGSFYPYTDYEGSYYQEVYETGEYIHYAESIASGSWIFVCGPVFDDQGNIAALIETGYDQAQIRRQTRDMIVQTLLIVIATTIAFLLVMIEFILIGNAYKQNKLEWSEDAILPFRPELLRGIVFFQFFSANLATALLPIYADRLYEPVLNFPRELVITFPFTANVIMVILSQLGIPKILKKIGIQQTGFVASLLFVAGNALCFIAQNVIHLSMGYALLGFSGGTLVLVLNAVIGSRKKVEDVTSGFAHYNASYLAGINVGVVFGSIVAQFFTYRIVFLFAAAFSVVLLILYVFSTRSKYLRYFYYMTREEPVPANYKQEDYSNTQREKKFALLKFIFNPVVLVTLFMVLLPYVASMSFTEYFLPIFGIDNGLTESNIGQLILLSGLFAILFGTSLCEYFATRFPFKVIIGFSMVLTAGAVYLFSLYVSVTMMIAAVVIIAIASIFALTNIQTYYATLYKDTLVPSITALSVYSMVENLALAVGPVVFSYILMAERDLAQGLRFFAAAMLGCLAVFVIISGIAGKKKRSGR